MWIFEICSLRQFMKQSLMHGARPVTHENPSLWVLLAIAIGIVIDCSILCKSRYR
jgi:hypothetical protein